MASRDLRAPPNLVKVSIVGVGRVGAALALTLVAQQTADELVLVGRDHPRTEAEAMDLQHAAALGRMIRIRAGDIDATADSDVVVLTAGVSQPVAAEGRGPSRTGVAAENAELLAQMVPALVLANPRAIFLVVTNPVDAMTTVTLECSGLTPNRVIGMGTLLDTMRLRDLLSRRLGTSPDDIRAYMLGEHGPHQFAAFSSASVGGGDLGLPRAELEAIEAEAREVGVTIFGRRGHTSHGIALSVARVIEAIARDTREILPLSVWPDGIAGITDICLSLPVIVGRSGIVGRIAVRLSEPEAAALQDAAAAIRATVASLRGGDSG